MPQTNRKPHRKSRKGCRECKDRKVKCDEKHPVCGNCSVYFKGLTSCHWDGELAVRVLVEPSETAKFDQGSSDGALLQLRLFHHYTTYVAGTLKPNSEAWIKDVPTLALRYPNLLDSVLGLSVLHLSRHGDLVSSEKVYGYLDSALTAHRDAVANVTSETAASVGLSSMLLTRLYRNIHRSGPCQEYDSPSACLRMMQGMREFARIGNFAEKARSISGNSVHELFIFNHSEEILPLAQRKLLQGLASYDITKLLEGLEPQNEAHSVYFSAFESVLVAYNAILSGRCGFSMIYTTSLCLVGLSEEFIQLLDQFDQRAMCMLAQIYAASKLGETYWWNQGLALYEVSGMASLVQPEWQWAMQMPLRVVKLVQEFGFG